MIHLNINVIEIFFILYKHKNEQYSIKKNKFSKLDYIWQLHVIDQNIPAFSKITDYIAKSNNLHSPTTIKTKKRKASESIY